MTDESRARSLSEPYATSRTSALPSFGCAPIVDIVKAVVAEGSVVAGVVAGATDAFEEPESVTPHATIEALAATSIPAHSARFGTITIVQSLLTLC